MHECLFAINNHISVVYECSHESLSAVGGCGPMPGRAGLNASLKDWWRFATIGL
jgi:hypothetical protein